LREEVINVAIQNCKKCGKLFVSAGLSICEDCVKKEDEQFEIVKQYLLENPRSSVIKVSEATGVPVETVTEFMRQGRLIGIEPDDAENILVCSICKKPISSGRICEQCQKALSGDSSFGSERKDDKMRMEEPKLRTDDKTVKSRERMYTIDLIRKKKE